VVSFESVCVCVKLTCQAVGGRSAESRRETSQTLTTLPGSSHPPEENRTRKRKRKRKRTQILFITHLD